MILILPLQASPVHLASLTISHDGHTRGAYGACLMFHFISLFYIISDASDVFIPMIYFPLIYLTRT